VKTQVPVPQTQLRFLTENSPTPGFWKPSPREWREEVSFLSLVLFWQRTTVSLPFWELLSCSLTLIFGPLVFRTASTSDRQTKIASV